MNWFVFALTDRYNPSNVGILEDYLYHQIRSQEYDCLANLAILKLWGYLPFDANRYLSDLDRTCSYQFNPDLYNPDVVINILIKALTASPFPDFNLCVSLLDERVPSVNQDEPDPLPSLLPVLISLHTLLQQCKFPKFWEDFHSDELDNLRDNYTVECVGFEDAIREVVVRAVKGTFSRIGTERLGNYLDLNGESSTGRKHCSESSHQVRVWTGGLRIKAWMDIRLGEERYFYPTQSRQPDRVYSRAREYQTSTYVNYFDAMLVTHDAIPQNWWKSSHMPHEY